MRLDGFIYGSSLATRTRDRGTSSKGDLSIAKNGNAVPVRMVFAYIRPCKGAGTRGAHELLLPGCPVLASPGANSSAFVGHRSARPARSRLPGTMEVVATLETL